MNSLATEIDDIDRRLLPTKMIAAVVVEEEGVVVVHVVGVDQVVVVDQLDKPANKYELPIPFAHEVAPLQ